MKKQILTKLNAIAKAAALTQMEGTISITFSGCSVSEFDSAVDSINEFPKWKHFVDVAPKLTVALLMG